MSLVKRQTKMVMASVEKGILRHSYESYGYRWKWEKTWGESAREDMKALDIREVTAMGNDRMEDTHRMPNS